MRSCRSRAARRQPRPDRAVWRKIPPRLPCPATLAPPCSPAMVALAPAPLPRRPRPVCGRPRPTPPPWWPPPPLPCHVAPAPSSITSTRSPTAVALAPAPPLRQPHPVCSRPPPCSPAASAPPDLLSHPPCSPALPKVASLPHHSCHPDGGNHGGTGDDSRWDGGNRGKGPTVVGWGREVECGQAAVGEGVTAAGGGDRGEKVTAAG